MRRALALFAIVAFVGGQEAEAQQAFAQQLTLPSGVTVARSCDKIESEGVLVTSLDSRAVVARDSQYLGALAQIIARRVGMRAGDPPRTATYGVLLLRDGTVAQRFPVERSGQRKFDTSIDDALALSSTDADREPMPAGMPDSMRLLVTFGQHRDGSPFVASHTRCSPMEYPDNPHHEDPLWARAQPRSVTVRGVVSAAGRVDTATALVDDPSDERYVEAAMSVVAQMRFVPAEYDGMKVPSPMVIVVPFGVMESSAAEPRTP